ncbi:tRNA (adenosine(37)-N6)-threonylcarbamoyltransferase complex ATPase subunit type 1 TsaE [Fluviicola sp.]|uniref:tRNA (adenosine(37)-N6)-threonylcarbamoyltransferase complex ATPase subunit type 1 TsaE n=1 Tax=Fluviicola sp. TaxID=1917219 RepID=UPI0028173656|nr:tRNA (adenosine(37)-N6)-threonylcarbamoyltransferase complex ATPase subunit type 1 TsaE [Fluviicola sp.]MDR0802889.1 tRNA (adenosine(37)-N6)-threonylcarbamoyltransferase complex ATPase subunit type 1 TsaE [Fluviicola sp.]
MKELIAHNLEDVPFVAKVLLEQLDNRKIVAFYAEMGSGKTTLITAVLRAMGIENPEGSPTYSLVNSYDSPYFGEVLHFDVYRLNSIEEALDAGIEELLYSGAYCLVEWAEIIESLLPDELVTVRMRVNENGERLIQII